MIKEKLGKGALPDLEDKRDFSFAFVAAGSAPVDWNKEYRVDNPPNENQGSSDACVAYASSYFNWQFRRKNFSRRDLFSRIALTWGAYLRDGVKTICEIGQQTRDECPDPTKPTMSNMRVKSDKPDSFGADDKGKQYFRIHHTPSIDQLAQAVRDWKGAVFGIYTEGWTDKNYPKPAPINDGGHALYAMGYHTHSDGKKCIIAKSSWCTSSHHEHHINEDHFLASKVFDGWVLVPNNPMRKRYLVNKEGKMGVLVSEQESFSDVIIWAKSEAHFEQLKKDYEIPADAQTIIYPI